MDISSFKQDTETIINPGVKDQEGLNDFQKVPDLFGIAIPKVGIERFRVPLMFKHLDGRIMNHDSEVSLYISLTAGKTGVNMSRFCAILQDASSDEHINGFFLKKILKRLQNQMKDNPSDPEIENAYISIKFMYPIKQKSLKSNNWGWQYYPCEIKAHSKSKIQDSMDLVLEYEYSSTCPCSLSMSKQYELDYKQGKTTEGNGIGTAHSQRSKATITISHKNNISYSIEDLINLTKIAIPTETQSLVKRPDEQAFAILNGEHPMFVEHAARRISIALDSEERILDWNVKIEHFESLHSHNAVAYIQKKLPNSFN